MIIFLMSQSKPNLNDVCDRNNNLSDWRFSAKLKFLPL
jgi:hypothetical protein